MRASILIYSQGYDLKGLSRFKDMVQNKELCHYASDIFDSSGAQDFEEFEMTLNKVLIILKTAQVPLSYHIQTTFRAGSGQVFKDWKLSSLACFLIRINGNPHNEQVALSQMQAYNDQGTNR